MAPKPYLDTHDRRDYYTPHKSSTFESELLKLIKAEFRGYVGGLPLWGVNGKYVRVKDIDFTTGANPARYLYVPPPELWVEKFCEPDDVVASTVHEGTETIYMIAFKMSYDDAHDAANNHEYVIRQAVWHGRLVIRTHEEAVRFADLYLREVWRRLEVQGLVPDPTSVVTACMRIPNFGRLFVKPLNVLC